MTACSPIVTAEWRSTQCLYAAAAVRRLGLIATEQHPRGRYERQAATSPAVPRAGTDSPNVSSVCAENRRPVLARLPASAGLLAALDHLALARRGISHLVAWSAAFVSSPAGSAPRANAPTVGRRRPARYRPSEIPIGRPARWRRSRVPRTRAAAEAGRTGGAQGGARA
jgi:hypothetical protein